MDLFVSYDPEREAGDRLAPEVVDEICLISGSDECGGGGGNSDIYERFANKGQINGYAALDGTARLPAAQLPLPALEYKGTWNASSNTPTLSNGSGNLGDIWRVSTAGNDLGFPVEVGDVIFYDGNAWYKLGSGSGSGDYTLPVATATTLGGVKVSGNGLSVAADGTLTATVNSTTLASYQLKAEKGVNNGYASLDASGKLPSSQLPLSALEYKGTWNAATNTPPLAAGVGTQGDMWRVTVTGTQFGVKFTAGDFALFNGTSWETATSGTAGVSTVAGLTGDVAAGPLKTALALDKVDNTADAAKNVLSATKLTTPRTLNGVPFDGTADITVPISGSDPALANYQFKSEKGAPDGYAPLDGGSKVPAANLPSYVDDVLEFPTQADLPQPGTAGVIYVDLATGNTFRWSGTTYTAVSDKVTSTGITDSTVVGRAVVTAADPKAGRTALNAGPTVNVKEHGAVGDNVVNDTAAIQAAIDAAVALLPADILLARSHFSHVTVMLPPGRYRVANLSVPTGVTLVGDGATVRPVPGTTGNLITFKAGQWGGLRHLNIQAANDTDDLAGVMVENGRQFVSIENCSIFQFRRQAVIVAGGSFYTNHCFFEGFRGNNADLADYAGVLELRATANDAWVSLVELNGTRYSALGPTSPNHFACGLVVNGAGNVMGLNIITENADTGVYAKDVLLMNLQGVRAELCYSHGFLIESGSGRLSDCQAWDNSKNGTGLADGFHMGTDTTNFSCSNLVSVSLGAIKHRYGFYDVGTFANNRNTYFNPRSVNDTATFADIPGVRVGGPLYDFAAAGAAVQITGPTPDISGRAWLRASGTSTITNFVGTVPGQLFRVLGNGTTTVENNATIKMLTGAATVLTTGTWYTFLKHDGVHTEVDLSGPSYGKTLNYPNLVNPKANFIMDINGNESVAVPAVTSAVNYVSLNNSAAGVPVSVFALGDDPNVGLQLGVKGTERCWLYQSSGANFRFQAGGPGATADIGINLIPKGVGTVQAGGVQVETKGHTHTVAQVTGAESTANKGAVSGYAPLGTDSKVPAVNLPARWAAVPGTASAAGTAGDVAYDATHMYVCVTTGAAGAAAWKRTPLTAW